MKKDVVLKPLTLAQAKALRHGETICQRGAYNADGTPRRWRVNGTPKTWKRDPERVQVPLKHGMYRFGYLDEGNLSAFGWCP